MILTHGINISVEARILASEKKMQVFWQDVFYSASIMFLEVLEILDDGVMDVCVGRLDRPLADQVFVSPAHHLSVISQIYW
jgi:hypothetical protein